MTNFDFTPLPLSEMRKQAIACTATHDWHWHGNDANAKLTLLRSGWEKMAAVFGVSLTLRTCEPRLSYDPEGKLTYFVYTAGVSASFESPLTGRLVSVDEAGVSASDDDFVAKRRQWNDAEQRSESITLDAEAVNEGYVMKKAVTNAYGRAVTTLLGLGDVTEDELKAAGVPPPEKREGKSSGGKSSSSQDPAKIQSMKEEVQKIAMAVARDRVVKQYPDAVPEAWSKLMNEQYPKVIAELTVYGSRPGVGSLNDLSDKAVYPVLSKAKALYYKTFGESWYHHAQSAQMASAPAVSQEAS